MTVWNLDDRDEDREESPEHRAERIEDTMALGIMGRDELDLMWGTTTEAECRRNQRRYAVARTRATTATWPKDDFLTT